MTYKFAEPGKYIGGYRFGDVRFNLTRKPSRWHRFWVRFTLGWTWQDDTPERT